MSVVLAFEAAFELEHDSCVWRPLATNSLDLLPSSNGTTARAAVVARGHHGAAAVDFARMRLVVDKPALS